MKKNLNLILIFAAFGLIFVSSMTVYSQRVLGGYKEISKDDEGALAAAEFAVQKKSEEQEVTISLESIEKAESQTVAGVNYRLCIKVYGTTTEGERSETVAVQVVVHRNLQGEFSLTSWSDEECASSQ